MSEHERFPIAAIRVKEIMRLFRYRWGPTLPDDHAGRDTLWLVLQHLASLRSARQRMLNFTQVFSPWLRDCEREMLFDEILRNPPQMYSADELGVRLSLRDIDRTALGIKTIGAIDCNKEQREARRRLKNRDRERERRAVLKKHQRGATQPRIEIDAAILRCFLADFRKLAISDIAKRAIRTRDPFVLKPDGRPLDQEGARRKLNRLADRLGERLEEDVVLGRRNSCRMRRIWWKRTLGTKK
jgi:hypothetical protein